MGLKLIKQKKEVKISPSKDILGIYNLDDLDKYDVISLYNKLNKNELNNLKYLKEKNRLYLKDKAYFSLNDIIIKLKEFGKNNEIILEVTDKKVSNEFILNKDIINYKNISVKQYFDSYSLKDYIYFENLLYKMIEPAKNLSTFEKYIYVYNIVKNFKQYKESDRRLASRNLYYILVNEYATCVGFCALFSDLLSKLDIPNIPFSIEGIDSKDNSKWGHRRLYVNLKDEKYGINGFYVSDPTWDNDLEVDYYNHLVLTNKESKLECDFEYQYLYDEFNLFNIDNIDDLYIKLNDIVNDDTFEKLLKVIKELDLNYYNYLKNKFDIEKPNQKMLNDLSMYINAYINNDILGDTIMSAVETIYRHSYGYKEEILEEKLEEVRNINSKRQNSLFPSRIRVSSDTEADIIVLQNKFEKSSNKISKY